MSSSSSITNESSYLTPRISRQILVNSRSTLFSHSFVVVSKSSSMNLINFLQQLPHSDSKRMRSITQELDTLTSVTHVTDSCQVKSKKIWKSRNDSWCLCPEWVNKTVARQRADRAGRTREGMAYQWQGSKSSGTPIVIIADYSPTRWTPWAASATALPLITSETISYFLRVKIGETFFTCFRHASLDCSPKSIFYTLWAEILLTFAIESRPLPDRKCNKHPLLQRVPPRLNLSTLCIFPRWEINRPRNYVIVAITKASSTAGKSRKSRELSNRKPQSFRS